MTLSCLSAVKRIKDNKFQRPPAIPVAVFAGFTGDRSGSMSTMGNIPAEGLYDWIKSQASSAINNGQQAFISVTTFDDKAELKMDNIPAKNIVISAQQCREWMTPRGCTRLYDTAIEDLARLQRREKEYRASLSPATRLLSPRTVIIWALMTDGFHNEGRMTASDLNTAVKLARKNGVQCFFLAANQDACATGARYGFDVRNSLKFDSAPVAYRGASTALNTNMLRSATSGHAPQFTQTQRQSSCPVDFDSDDDTTPPMAPVSRGFALGCPPALYRTQNLRQPAQQGSFVRAHVIQPAGGGPLSLRCGSRLFTSPNVSSHK